MKKTNKFYKWFISIGGNVADINIGNIHENLNKIDFKISSFKNRASEIKEKYNHKFDLKREDFKNYPNIEKLIFEPKK